MPTAHRAPNERHLPGIRQIDKARQVFDKSVARVSIVRPLTIPVAALVEGKYVVTSRGKLAELSPRCGRIRVTMKTNQYWRPWLPPFVIREGLAVYLRSLCNRHTGHATILHSDKDNLEPFRQNSGVTHKPMQNTVPTSTGPGIGAKIVIVIPVLILAITMSPDELSLGDKPKFAYDDTLGSYPLKYPSCLKTSETISTI